MVYVEEGFVEFAQKLLLQASKEWYMIGPGCEARLLHMTVTTYHESVRPTLDSPDETEEQDNTRKRRRRR